MILAALGPFGDAIDFIFHQRESQAGTVQVGGLAEIWELTSEGTEHRRAIYHGDLRRWLLIQAQAR